MMPLAMEKVSGISAMVTNAGMASFMSPHSISLATRIIMAPTSTSDGPTAHGGTLISSGEKKSDARKHADTVIAVTPVLPPSLIPAVDSMYVVTVVLPSAALSTVEPASTRKARYSPSNPPAPSVNPPYSAMEYIVLVVSRTST